MLLQSLPPFVHDVFAAGSQSEGFAVGVRGVGRDVETVRMFPAVRADLAQLRHLIDRFK